jgi:hypothetical protein
MTVFSLTAVIAGTTPSVPSTYIQNLGAADSISALVTTPSTAFPTWDVSAAVGATPNLFSGTRGDTITITPNSGATSYFITLQCSRYNYATQSYVIRYARIEGTIAAGPPPPSPWGS